MYAKGTNGGEDQFAVWRWTSDGVMLMFTFLFVHAQHDDDLVPAYSDQLLDGADATA